METPAGVRVNRSAVLASLGLSTNLLWCTLAGHTGGFPSSLHDLDPAVNPRIFFLLGILIVGVAFAVGPRWLRERDQPFSYVLPLASSIGTASFALASNQSLFDPIFLAIAGLIMFGAGYFWIASRFYLLLARTQTFACTAWCIVAALGMETLVLPIARYAVPPVWQIAVTIALPLVSAALFKAARSSAPTESAQNITRRADLPGARMEALAAQPRRAVLPAGREGRRSLLVLIAAAALLLATVRSFSSIGLWGSEAVAAQGIAAEVVFSLVSTAFLALFALATLVKTTGWRLDLRFQPAFIIVIGGLFLVVSQNAAPGIPAALLDALMRLDDSCAHVLFWIVVVTAIDALTMPSYRVMGVAAAVYALSSVLWVALLGSGVAFSSMIMLDGEGKRSGQSRTHDCAPFKRRSHGRARITRHRGSMRRHRSREQAFAPRNGDIHPPRSGKNANPHPGRTGACREHGENAHRPHLRETRHRQSSGDDGPRLRRHRRGRPRGKPPLLHNEKVTI